MKLWNPEIGGLCVQGVPCERGDDGSFEIPDALATPDLVASLGLRHEPPAPPRQEEPPKRRR